MGQVEKPSMPSLVIELLDFLSFKIIAALMLRVLMTQECITDRHCWEEVNQSHTKSSYKMERKYIWGSETKMSSLSLHPHQKNIK